MFIIEEVYPINKLGGEKMPTLSNIVVNPEAKIISCNEKEKGLKEAVVEVKGLLCFL